MIKFGRTLNLLLLATLAVTNIFLNGYKREDSDNEADSSKDNEVGSCKQSYLKNLNAENMIQNIGLWINSY
jgi:hypothetical protein